MLIWVLCNPWDFKGGKSNILKLSFNQALTHCHNQHPRHQSHFLLYFFLPFSLQLHRNGCRTSIQESQYENPLPSFSCVLEDVTALCLFFLKVLSQVKLMIPADIDNRFISEHDSSPHLKDSLFMFSKFRQRCCLWLKVEMTCAFH